ncbi:MAG: ATP-binding protein [Gaiellaceae bacterium]
MHAENGATLSTDRSAPRLEDWAPGAPASSRSTLSRRQTTLTPETEALFDGKAISSPSHTGVGLSSMRERAAERGGTCTVEPCPDGGTCVHARLPLTSA